MSILPHHMAETALGRFESENIRVRNQREGLFFVKILSGANTGEKQDTEEKTDRKRGGGSIRHITSFGPEPLPSTRAAAAFFFDPIQGLIR